MALGFPPHRSLSCAGMHCHIASRLAGGTCGDESSRGRAVTEPSATAGYRAPRYWLTRGSGMSAVTESGEEPVDGGLRFRMGPIIADAVAEAEVSLEAQFSALPP